MKRDPGMKGVLRRIKEYFLICSTMKWTTVILTSLSRKHFGREKMMFFIAFVKHKQRTMFSFLSIVNQMSTATCNG